MSITEFFHPRFFEWMDNQEDLQGYSILYAEDDGLKNRDIRLTLRSKFAGRFYATHLWFSLDVIHSIRI